MEKTIRDLLPPELGALLSEKGVEELRLTKDAWVLLKINGESRTAQVKCTDELMEKTLLSLTNRSFYSHEDTIKEGYIPLPGGYRAGVCGTAVCSSGSIGTVKEITSIVIRVPARRPGVERDLIDAWRKISFSGGVLIAAPPGEGKTTVLRELAYTMCTVYRKNVALIDGRGELSSGLPPCPGMSVYLNYPKAEAVEMAIRTMSPELVVIDEIGKDETAKLLSFGFGGTLVAASVHAQSINELKRRRDGEMLLSSGVFSIAARLYRENGAVHYGIEYLGGPC